MLRLCLLLSVLAIAGIAWPGWASAHAILIDSQPPALASLQPGPAAITLRFNSRVDHERSRIALRSEGNETVLPISQSSAADSLAAAATLEPGDYTVRWQVLAVDGHITRGDVAFTVQPPSGQVSAAKAP